MNLNEIAALSGRELDAIRAAHPTAVKTPEAHQRYAEAVRMVGAKRSKYALVYLVNWLMAERDKGELNGR